jgi:redox-sensitive bicupin YhaK (pirin superfamily)
VTLDPRPAAGRFHTVASGRETWHSFSFGAHYDPRNVGFGPLAALNDERLEPGAGYAAHPHRDVDLVTWVLDGVLVHEDSSGDRERLPAGTVQVHSAGSGIEHSEAAGPEAGPVRFLQAWLRPDADGGPPVRRTTSLAGLLGRGLVPVVSGDGSTPLAVRVAGATLWAATPATGDRVSLPAAPLVLAFLATGAGRLEAPAGVGRGAVGGGLDGRELGAGDAVRITDEPRWSLLATEPGLVLVWTFTSR